MAIDAESALKIHLFGQPRLEYESRSVRLVAPPKTLPLLAYLLLHRDRPVSRDALAFTMWEDETEDRARANLRRHLYALGRALPKPPDGQAWVTVGADWVQWRDGAAWLDVAEFERLVKSPASRAQAADLYAGDLLANLYDDWLFPLRERLRTEYLNALDALVLEHRSRRDLHAAADYAQRMLRTDPWREDALRHLIAARYEAGDRAGALAIYDQFKRRLRDEMDVDPMPETQALRDVVVRNAPLVEQQAQGALQRADASRAQHLNLPFVGRDAEMEQLRALWSRAARGRGGLAFVSGEAGIGKTRLVSELALLVESEGGRVTYGGTSSPEAAPYQCLADALRSALPLVAAMELEPIWLSVIAQIVPELRTRVPDLPELPATDPGRDRLRLFEGIARGLEALARSRPLLVIVEDLHWAGEATLSALRFAARRAAAASILIVGTYREEEAPRTHPLRRLRRELSAERIVAGLSPQRLSPVFVAELIAALPQTLAIDAAGARSLHEQSEGNPLFLAQLVRDRIESQEPVRGVLSGGIKDIIETRIARLSERGLAFAGFAAVVGQGFDAEVVAELSGWEQHELFEALSELIDRHLVQETGGRGRAAYSFTHHLIQATVYDGMDAPLRMRRHQRLAHVLSDITERADHASSEIARHHDLGGESALAAAAYLAAARHASSLHADEDAYRYVARLLELDPSPALRAQALLLREAVLGRRGDRAGQERDLDALEALADAQDDDALRCEALYRRIVRAHSLGERDGEAALISRLKRRATAAGDPRWIAAASLARATRAAQVDSYESAREAASAALSSYEALGDVPGQVESLCVLAHVVANRGGLDEAKELLERARTAALAHGNAGLVGRALLSASGAALIQHNFAECIALCEEAVELYRSIGDREGEADALVRAATAYARLSRFDKTNERSTAALEIFDAIGKRQGQATVLINRSILAVRLGAFDEAAEAMSRARDTFEALHDKRGLTACDINLAAVRLWQGRPDEARSLAREALALARSLKLPAYEAAALANIGTAERNLGDFKAGIEHLEASLRLRRKVKRPADAINDLADLVIAYLRAKDIKGALRTAKLLQSHSDQWLDAALWPQYCYWSLAQAYRAAGMDKEAKAALARAGSELDAASAAIEDPAGRATFARLAFNEEIAAARERGVWPRY